MCCLGRFGGERDNHWKVGDSPHSRSDRLVQAQVWCGFGFRFQMKSGGRNAWLGQLKETLPPNPRPPQVQGDSKTHSAVFGFSAVRFDWFWLGLIFFAMFILKGHSANISVDGHEFPDLSIWSAYGWVLVALFVGAVKPWYSSVGLRKMPEQTSESWGSEKADPASLAVQFRIWGFF